ncbi:MAG: gamma-glutamyltransferase [Burkholderiaceae bacterium]
MSQTMVSTPQPEATEAALDVLRDGGNAVDAAIGAALVQSVVDPQMCGIAGFGSMHVYQAATGEHACIDFHGRAPLATRPDMWADRIERETDDGFGFVLRGRVNEMGHASSTTPLSLRAFDEALRRFGTRSMADTLAPAIDWCERGFMVRPAVHAFWLQPAIAGRIARLDAFEACEATRKLYFKPDGSLYRVGEIFRNPDMARTYRRIAEHGVDDFYVGGIARRIDADMRAHGGLITMADLAACDVEHHRPLRGSYRGFEVLTNQPPGGGLMILEMLNILEQFDLAAMGHNSARYIATVSEAMKAATIDKDSRMGDPRFVDIPVDELAGKAYAATLADRIRAGERLHVPRVNTGGPESKETTHVCVVDAQGNIANMTHSLGSSNGVVTDGLGFMYNNCMMVFDPRPGRPGSLAPGKARFSAMCPTMLFRDGEPFLALGAPGGTTITMGVLQAILNVVDFGMSAQEAVSAPRFCTTSDTIELTNRILHGVERELQGMGYPTARYAVSYMMPLVHAIRRVNGCWDGGADPAGDGLAAGLPA